VVLVETLKGVLGYSVLVVAVHVCIPTNIHHVLRTIDAMNLWWQTETGSGSPRPIHVQYAAQRIQPQICLPATGSGRGSSGDWPSLLCLSASCGFMHWTDEEQAIIVSKFPYSKDTRDKGGCPAVGLSASVLSVVGLVYRLREVRIFLTVALSCVFDKYCLIMG
jgi:hypothetical protein